MHNNKISSMYRNFFPILVIVFMTGCFPQEDAQHQFAEMSPLDFYQNSQEMEPTAVKVTGKIPDWVQGQYVRNGPGIIKGKNTAVKSWFDGLAKLHAFTFDHGKVTYCCKFLRSKAYENFKKTGTLDFAGFAQQSSDEVLSFLDFLLGIPNEEITNANVNVSKINNRMVALTEIPLPVEFDVSLNTLQPFDYGDDLPKNYIFESAHILQDPDTKAMWNFLIKIGLFESAYQIYHIPPGSSERKLVASIPVSAISYMHSFSLAGKYLVLVDYPFRAKDPKDIATGFIDAFEWYRLEASTVYVIDKTTGKYWTYSANALFSFHHINGFEKDGKIFIDMIAYPNADIIYRVNKYPFIDHADNTLMRLEIDLQTGTTTTRQVSSDPMEFPRINDEYIGKQNQFFYAVHIRKNGNGIIKYNNDGPHAHWFEEGSYANEAIFVAHPNAQSEDDGLLLSVINNLKSKQSYLLILDAKSMTELARIDAPQFIPFGFHGQFFR
jgi:beta,beta-carotene 9',10'-dioxygenase